MRESVIVSAARLPTGKFLGALKSLPATDLGARVVREAVARAGIEPEMVDECIMGNVVSAGAGQAPARQAAIRGGLGDHVAASDHQQGVRVGPQGGDARLAGHRDRGHRRRGGRGHGVDEQLPLHADAGPRGHADGQRRGPRLDDPRRSLVLAREPGHGHRLRGGGRALRGLARRPGRVRRRQPPQGGAGHPRVPVQGRDPARRDPPAPRRPHPPRLRRSGAARHQRRGPRPAAARLQEGGRHRHRRECPGG